MKVLKTIFRERFSRIFLQIVKTKWNITVLNSQGFAALMESLRCHDGNGNENANNKQNNNSAGTSPFFCTFIRRR